MAMMKKGKKKRIEWEGPVLQESIRNVLTNGCNFHANGYMRE